MRVRCRILDPESPTTTHWLDDAEVVVTDGRFSHVGPWRGGIADYDWRDAVVTPGFVDAHVHYPQTRIVGAASGPLLQWLATHTFPEEARFADDAHAAAVARYFVTSLAACGTTLAMVYGSVHASAAHLLFDALSRSGLRAIAGPVLMDEDAPEALLVPAPAAMDALETLVRRWHGHDDRLQVAVMPRFALSCSPTMMANAGALAQREHLWVSTHLSENRQECAVATERFGTADYLRIYEDAGLVHDRAVFAHCVHLSDSEWDRIASAGAVVAHCPDSNFFLGSGRMPVTAALERGVPVALGTDVAAGRTFRVPRIASSAYDNALASGHTLSLPHLLWWATAGGALALGSPHIGRIATGFDADFVVHDVPEWVTTQEQALATVLFDHDAPRPRSTWVRGREIWRRGSAPFPWREASAQLQ